MASSPETFLVLLNKIVKPEDQEKAVENAIERLVRYYKETSPLLNALKGKTFRSERLEYLAIQKAFMEGVKGDISMRSCQRIFVNMQRSHLDSMPMH